jgi:hypothetical protein
MDIYRFFNSRDVAEHCIRAGKVWNTLEMAVIIRMSENRTALKERQDAYRELLSEYPDMPVPKNHHGYTGDSVHYHLGRYLETESSVMEKFSLVEPDTMYRIGISNPSEGICWAEEPFSSPGKALEYGRDEWKPEEAESFTLEKRWFDSKSYITVKMDYSGAPLFVSWGGNPCEIDCDAIHFLDSFYIDIPAPFQPGDILYGSWGAGNKTGLIVVDYIRCNDKKLHASKLKRGGDMSDMTYSGYSFVGDSLFWDWHFCYSDLEYFRGELTGKERLLQCAGWLIQEKISVGAFSVMQNKIMMEHWLKQMPDAKEMGCILPENTIFTD